MKLSESISSGNEWQRRGSSGKRSKISIFLTEEQMKAGRGAAMIALWFWEFPPTQVLLPSLYVDQDSTRAIVR
jgi:hypothetical protein